MSKYCAIQEIHKKTVKFKLSEDCPFYRMGKMQKSQPKRYVTKKRHLTNCYKQKIALSPPLNNKGSAPKACELLWAAPTSQ